MAAAIYTSLPPDGVGIAQGVCSTKHHHSSGTPHSQNDYCVDWKFTHMYWRE